MIGAKDNQANQQNRLNAASISPQTQSSFVPLHYQSNNLTTRQFVGFKLLTAFSSVILSEFLIAHTLAKFIFSTIYDKRYKATLLQPEPSEKIKWVTKQIKNLMKTTIRYNSIIFCSKVLLDQHYAQTKKQNQTYYQSNSALHYKIGALAGLIGYAATIPIGQFESIKAMNKVQTNFSFNSNPEPKNNAQRLKNVWSQFLTIESFRRMLTTFNVVSLTGTIIYRTIYFGSYEKLKEKYNHPFNDYVLAPIGCSALALIVSPIDQIKYLQMTSHKGKPFIEIINEKGFKLWNLPGQKIYTSIIKQSFAMSMFVAGQNLCKYMIDLKNSSE